MLVLKNAYKKRDKKILLTRVCLGCTESSRLKKAWWKKVSWIILQITKDLHDHTRFIVIYHRCNWSHRWNLQNCSVQWLNKVFYDFALQNFQKYSIDKCNVAESIWKIKAKLKYWGGLIMDKKQERNKKICLLSCYYRLPYLVLHLNLAIAAKMVTNALIHLI